MGNFTYHADDGEDEDYSYDADASGGKDYHCFKSYLQCYGAYWILLLALRFTTAVIGLVGNLVVCHVIVWSKNARTVANLYLASLSISDTVILLGALCDAFSDAGYVIEYLPATVFLVLAEVMAAYVSILTVTAFTIERYLAIFYPLYRYVNRSMRWTKLTISIIWLAGFVCMCLYLIMGTFNLLKILCLCSFIPIVIIAIVYTAIIWKLSRASTIENNQSQESLSPQRAGLKVMAVIIVLTFVCWTPTFLAVMDSDFDSRKLHPIHQVIIGFVYSLSPAANPMIYSGMSTTFRRNFKEVYARQCTSCWIGGESVSPARPNV